MVCLDQQTAQQYKCHLFYKKLWQHFASCSSWQGRAKKKHEDSQEERRARGLPPLPGAKTRCAALGASLSSPRTIPKCQILHEHPWYRYKYTWRAPFFVQPGSQAEMRHNQRVWHSSGHDLYPCPERMAPSPNRIALGGHCLCNISAARARLQQCPAAPVENGLRTLGLGP